MDAKERRRTPNSDVGIQNTTTPENGAKHRAMPQNHGRAIAWVGQATSKYREPVHAPAPLYTTLTSPCRTGSTYSKPPQFRSEYSRGGENGLSLGSGRLLFDSAKLEMSAGQALKSAMAPG